MTDLTSKQTASFCSTGAANERAAVAASQIDNVANFAAPATPATGTNATQNGNNLAIVAVKCPPGPPKPGCACGCGTLLQVAEWINFEYLSLGWPIPRYLS